MHYPLKHACTNCRHTENEHRTYCLCAEERDATLRTHIGRCPCCNLDHIVVSPARTAIEQAIMQPYPFLCDLCFEPRERRYCQQHPELGIEPVPPSQDDEDDIEERIARLCDSSEYPASDMEWC